MYQICTNTTVNNGHLRIRASGRRVVLARDNTGLPGVLDFATILLITRRSQVQILPPPPSKEPACGPPPRLSNELGPDVEGLGCARRLVGLHRAMPVPANHAVRVTCSTKSTISIAAGAAWVSRRKWPASKTWASIRGRSCNVRWRSR